MSLDDIRDASRAAVHAEFALPAVARSRDGLSQTPINARLHRDLRKPFGDLDREGFAMVIQTHNEVIVDSTEWWPKKNWIIDFGRGRVVSIDNMLSSKDERYQKLAVSGVTT